MPIYDYKCTECETAYDVYFKGREDKSMVVCPKCSSKKHVKLISVPGAAVSDKNSECGESCDNSGGGCCGGGMCGMN